MGKNDKGLEDLSKTVDKLDFKIGNIDLGQLMTRTDVDKEIEKYLENVKHRLSELEQYRRNLSYIGIVIVWGIITWGATKIF